MRAPPSLRVTYHPNDGRIPIQVGVSCPGGLEPFDKEQVALTVQDLVEILQMALKDRGGKDEPWTRISASHSSGGK
jgi:hypothetical protein